MSEPKFTPGPYFISGNAIGPRIDSDDQSDGMVSPVARIDRYDWPENWKFNAHLIAAAPDLYRKLELARFTIAMEIATMGPRTLDREEKEALIAEHPAIKSIDAALANARGEG